MIADQEGGHEHNRTRLKIESLDHLVLTVADIEATVAFYRDLGMDVVSYGDGRRALHFGTQKLNLHQSGAGPDPKAARATPGSADLCFVVADRIEDVVDHLAGARIPVVRGPARGTGARGPMTSIYFRDPDDNLVELACYGEATDDPA